MSFISKLFRKTESDPETASGQARIEDAAEEVQAAARESSAELETKTLPSASEPSSAPEEEWWESSAPIDEATPAQEDSNESDDQAPSHQVEQAEEKPAGLGTQPLEPGRATPISEAPTTADIDTTRQLNNDKLPAVAALYSQRGLAFAALRDIGRVRSINQDSIFGMLSTLPRESNDLPFGVFVVADGMGGHQGGEVASRLAISTVVQHILAELVVPTLADSSTEAIQPLLIEAVQTANRTIWEQAQTLGSDMGTTCTVALMLGHALYLGHVGDSRAYLATPTGLRLLTNDHSTVGRLIQVGQLDASEAREHPLRSQLYRTVGQQPEVLVDFSYQQLGDATHLLLASDGLWGMIDDDILLDVLQHHPWPQDACNELIARANLAGGDDNISAIVVSLPSGTSDATPRNNSW